jgi:DNA-binding response OmpR family regulator
MSYDQRCTLVETIAVVESHASNRAALTHTLGAAGFLTTEASTYQQGDALLKSAAPDVLVVGVELGAFNGLQLAMRCSRYHPETKIIVIGPASASLEHDARALGATAYIRRPLTRDELIDRVKTIVADAAQSKDTATAAFDSEHALQLSHI